MIIKKISVLIFTACLVGLISCKSKITLKETDYDNSNESFHLVKAKKSIVVSTKMQKKVNRKKNKLAKKNKRISRYNQKQTKKYNNKGSGLSL